MPAKGELDDPIRRTRTQNILDFSNELLEPLIRHILVELTIVVILGQSDSPLARVGHLWHFGVLEIHPVAITTVTAKAKGKQVLQPRPETGESLDKVEQAGS